MKYLSVFGFLLISFWGHTQVFQSDWNKAQELSQEENRLLVLVFSGSDWCGPCIKLDKEIWQDNSFENFADKHLVLYKADFPRKKANKLPQSLDKLHKELAASYNPNGFFPLVVVISQGNVVAQFGYEKIGALGYIEKLRKLID